MSRFCDAAALTKRAPRIPKSTDSRPFAQARLALTSIPMDAPPVPVMASGVRSLSFVSSFSWQSGMLGEPRGHLQHSVSTFRGVDRGGVDRAGASSSDDKD